jgi:glycosyltransferase involved in cell wall biosynthesis
MKLLHVIGSMNPDTGGPCQGVRSLTAYSLSHGETVEVVCLDDPNSDYLSRESLPIHALGEGRGSWRYHSALRPWLEKHLPRFDAIILNGLWQYPGYALARATQQPGMPPYYVFPHGMLDPWFQLAPGRRLKAIRNWFYWKLMEQRVVRNAEALLFTCAEEMRLAHDTFQPYQPKREINVGYGIPQPPAYHAGMKEAFAAKCPGLNGKPYFLFISRIHPKKGVGLLIKAYSALCRSLGDARHSQCPKLVVAGPGLEAHYGQQMQALDAQTCPQDSVLWPGMLTGDAKWGAIYNCETFVLPSHQENFGIAVVEALACGRPVLISDKVNIWCEIKEVGAALVQENSIAGTTRLFFDWVNLSTEARADMAARTKPCFQSHFSIESTARRLMEAVISGRKRQ